MPDTTVVCIDSLGGTYITTHIHMHITYIRNLYIIVDVYGHPSPKKTYRASGVMGFPCVLVYKISHSCRPIQICILVAAYIS